ncbi:MAG: hypothetical protein KBS85_07190 [Lachnospiraceae bacterium]|nr:hypothetical protein [Candidatus Merdinaster equi]
MDKIKKYKIDIIFIVSILAFLPFLIWKAGIGYGGGDEPFYITLASRFANGDVPLADEWNLAQLSALFLMPFYHLNNLIFGNTEGIVLHFRVFYIIMHVLTCTGLYMCLRKHGLGALLGVLIFYIYSPYDVMALSYNTMGVGLFALAMALLYKERDSRTQRGGSRGRKEIILLLLAGLCYGGAVLCNPFLIIAYAVYLIANVITAIVKKEFPTHLLFVTLGAAIVLMYLILVIALSGRMGEVFENLPHILNDPEHTQSGLYTIVYTYFYSIIHNFKMYLLMWLGVLVFAAIVRDKMACIYFGITVLAAAMQILILTEKPLENYNLIMFPMMPVGITAFVLSRKGFKDKWALLYFYAGGLLFTFCGSMSSNQGINVICQGMPILLLGASLLICSLGKSLMEENKFSLGLVVIFCSALFGALLGTEIYMKSVHAFWEPEVSSLDYHISEGPLAGVVTSKEHGEAYAGLLADLKEVKNEIGRLDANSNVNANSNSDLNNGSDKKRVLAVTMEPWSYLYLDELTGAHSSWISSTYSDKDPKQLLVSRLNEYYALHPDNIPEYVYVTKGESWYFTAEDLDSCFDFRGNGIDSRELELGYLCKAAYNK